jgi:hypothetical protein
MLRRSSAPSMIVATSLSLTGTPLRTDTAMSPNILGSVIRPLMLTSCSVAPRDTRPGGHFLILALQRLRHLDRAHVIRPHRIRVELNLI